MLHGRFLSYTTVVPAPQTCSTSKTTLHPRNTFLFRDVGLHWLPFLPLSNHCSPQDDRYHDQGQPPAMKTSSTPGRQGKDFWRIFWSTKKMTGKRRFLLFEKYALRKNTVTIGGWHSRTGSHTVTFWRISQNQICTKKKRFLSPCNTNTMPFPSFHVSCHAKIDPKWDPQMRWKCFNNQHPPPPQNYHGH